MNPKSQSLLLGLITIFCWGSLATFGNLLIHLPPFYILGVTFMLGALPGFLRPRSMFPEWKVFVLGVAGYFGYHFFLFYSFRFAPALEANLINYLWPVIMVLLTPVFFPGTRLKSYHLVGAILAVTGCVFLVFGKGGDLDLEHFKGYLLAFAAALSWPLYSLGKKKMPVTSVWAISGFCFGASVLSFLTHVWLEPHVVLQWHDAWKLILMGLGPFGIAFYCWDVALARGDARVMGALSYLTPVLSTLGLVFFANQEVSGVTAGAMVLIIGGASTGLLDFRSSNPLLK